MSIALMTLAWKTNLQSTQKLALLAMCDWANDDGGSLHPSIGRIAERVSCSERQAKRVIHELIDDDWLTVVGNEFGGAPGQSRRYQLNVNKLQTGDTSVTGDKSTRVTSMSRVTSVTRVTNEAGTGDMGVTRRVTSATQTGDMGVTQSVNRTIIEPSIEPSIKRNAPLSRPVDVSTQVWNDFVELRKQKRAKLTATALNGIRSEAAKAGVTLQSALETCCIRGWQSFRADWVEKQINGRPMNKLEKLEQANKAIGDEWLREQGFSV